MAVSLTLTPLSNAIIATVSGLDAAHEYDRRFVWSLDGRDFASETVEPGEETHTFTLAPVYFAAPHTVSLEIYGADAEELLASVSDQTTTLYADLPLWRWDASNGQASQAQVGAAHQTATTQGLVANYSHLVWDDFVRRIKDALDAVGLPWLTGSASYEGALVGETYGSLTAARFNAVVQNIRYPYWTWESLPGSYGYLGRQAVRRGDIVYGQYMVELARCLNVVLSIYNGTANTRETPASVYAALIHQAVSIARPSAPMGHTGQLGSLGEEANLATQQRVLFGASDRSTLGNDTSLVRQPSAPLKGAERLRLNHVAALMAQIWMEFRASEGLILSGSPVLHAGAGRPMTNNTELGLMQDVKLDYSPAELMQAAGAGQAVGLGALTHLTGANLNGAATVEQLAAATLAILYQIGVRADYSATFGVEGDLIKKSAANAAGAFSAGVSAAGTAEAVRPVMTAGAAITETASSGELEQGRPQWAQGAAGVVFLVAGGIEQRTPEKVRGRSRSVVEASATISSSGTVLHLFGSADVRAVTSGQMGDTERDPNWTYPEQSGDALYAAQSYHTDRIEEGIRIAWRPPVTDGSVMYIPQVFHADEKGGVLSLIYYSPVRSDGTLYIRQMNETLKGG